ncbi:MAG: general secretion pathway protein GspK [Usitatibacter sp.]
MMRSLRTAQRGVALVLVMWVSVLITVVASSFILERRTETMIVRNSVSMARAEAAADAGVQRAIYEMYRGDNAPDQWRRDGTPQEWSFDGVPVRVEIRDESAKIDINTAADPLLRGLLVSSGLDDEEASRILDAILDWRDPDSLKRPNGAEEPEYRAAGLTYKPANSQFQAIEELQLVLGMRPDLYRRLAPSITVFSRQTGVNTQLATREVLLAIPEMTSEIVDQFLARREEARKLGQPLPVLSQAGTFHVGNTMIAAVRSQARLDDGTIFSREAVALLRPVPRKPVTFVAWRESTAAPDESENTQQQLAQPPAKQP